MKLRENELKHVNDENQVKIESMEDKIVHLTQM